MCARSPELNPNHNLGHCEPSDKKRKENSSRSLETCTPRPSSIPITAPSAPTPLPTPTHPHSYQPASWWTRSHNMDFKSHGQMPATKRRSEGQSLFQQIRRGKNGEKKIRTVFLRNTNWNQINIRLIFIPHCVCAISLYQRLKREGMTSTYGRFRESGSHRTVTRSLRKGSCVGSFHFNGDNYWHSKEEHKMQFHWRPQWGTAD